MTCIEGDAIDFKHFLKHVEPAKDATDREECEKAFADERQKLPPVNNTPAPAEAAAAADGAGVGAGGVGARGGAGGSAESPQFTPLGLDEEERASRLANKGVLRVHLKRAAGLKAADKSGSSDPYVEAKLGKHTVKSAVCEQTLAPAWDETLVFKAMKLERVVAGGLTLRILDKDRALFDADDLLDTLQVSLSCLEDADAAAYAQALPAQGTIDFGVEWAEGAETPKKKKKKAEDGADGDEAGALPAAAPLPAPSAEGGGEDAAAASANQSAGSPSPDKAAKKKKKKKEEKTPRADAALETDETGDTKVLQTM